MTFSRWAACAVLALVGAPTLRAQDSTAVWSLGADHESGTYVGLAMSTRFRLEGELGLVRRKDESEYSFDVGTGPIAVHEDITTTSDRFGLGFLWQWPAGTRLRLYAGPRMGAALIRSEDITTGGVTGSASAKRTDWFVAGSVGAEYFPTERLSAGADVQLRGVAQGTATQSTTGSQVSGTFLPADPTLATRGLLVLRFYL